MLYLSILSGAQDYFTFINRAATFQYFGVPRLFCVLLWSCQSRFLSVLIRHDAFLWIHWLFFQLMNNLSGYLSPPTRALPIAGLQYLLEYYKLVLFELTQSYLHQLEFDYIIGLSVYAWIWREFSFISQMTPFCTKSWIMEN